MVNKDYKWYTITVITGKEQTVIENLKNRVTLENIEEISDFKIMLVPYLTQREIKNRDNGKAFKIREKNLYPGYIFIKMNMTNEAWFIVRNTQYVTGLVGSSGFRAKPTPVSDIQITKMEQKVEQIKAEFEDGKSVSSIFKSGMIVEASTDEIKNQVGEIVEVNNKDQKALVEIILFNQKTPTWFNFKNLTIKK